MDESLRWSRAGCRIAGIAFGIVTQLVFAVTVYFLFLFLRGGTGQLGGRWLIVDSLLAIQFGVFHSLLLLPSARSAISRVLPSEFFGSLFSICTCASLWLIFACWRTSSVEFWDFTGWRRTIVCAGFYGSWIALIWSLSLTGFGYQTGWTQWSHWLRRQRLPNRAFSECGAYRWLRHPVYLSFLGLIWFAPRMTADHATLTIVWTTYILIGSYLKDRRLTFYLGDTYRDYARRVPGYPGLRAGPLGKWTVADELTGCATHDPPGDRALKVA